MVATVVISSGNEGGLSDGSGVGSVDGVWPVERWLLW